MASLKELRNRIASVKATQKITKAMQMVAAAKLRRAQMAAEAARPYAERMEAVLANLAKALEGLEGVGTPLMVGTGKDDVHLLVVCTSERGLCGGFNSSIVRKAREQILALAGQGKQVKILCVGKKGYDQLRRQFKALIVDTVEFRGIKQLTFEHADQVGQKVRAMFEAGEFDVATVYFSEFKSVISQIPTAQQIIPASIPEATKAGWTSKGAIYEYEPEEADILADLLPLNITTQIFKALLENAASEQGARMSAMDSATRNAGEMIGKLTLNYNRTRQAQITKELIEIISGAEAL
ncbi:ATP synthase F0F1 subunit gamma [Methyloceanibacter methanicus]|uniref:ATP synthase gamma chain n=1 Tax=Methyloceanibacter methanicus TaxID=1774968 RepID=A0A1E3W3Z4_9HYPH|nr:F0F1 ATP synthase subunit gamma [Methyloceanibacter methanicus]ODS00538.1 ATP synthase F0F1 subunit gamma [Methyloceanibacter methanicus]